MLHQSLHILDKRIEEDGVKKIFEISAQLHKKIQEKNITFPPHTKLMCKIISKLRKIAKEERIVLRRSFKSAFLIRKRTKIKFIVFISGCHL
ncbi:hypothetical protein JCM12298_21820 [Desulfothermus naphthae]